MPWLYLKGIFTGDFSDALAGLVGTDAPGLSANTLVRLKELWQGELERWQGRGLSTKHYVCFWADGIYFQPRLDHDLQCILVIVGADDMGRKEVLAIGGGYRESVQSWREALLDLTQRGLVIAPELATGDDALGFFKALREVYGIVREQRCWVHKTDNVLNKLPKSARPRAKQRLQNIWMAETKDGAEKGLDFFLQVYGPKYGKAEACLAKDRDVLPAFYDFPADHWKHLRTTGEMDKCFFTRCILYFARTASPVEEIGVRTARDQMGVQDCMRLVLDPRPMPHDLVASSDHPSHPLGCRVRRPDLGQIARCIETRERSVIDLVGLHMRVRDRFHLQRVGDYDPMNKGRQHPRHRHAVAGRIDRHLIRRPRSSAEPLQRGAGHANAASRPQPALFPENHLPEGAVNVDTGHAPHAPLLSAKMKGAAGHTTTTDLRSRRNRARVAEAASY